MKTGEKYSIFKIVRQIPKIQIGVIGWVCPALTVGNSTVVGQKVDSVSLTAKHYCFLFSEDYIFDVHCTNRGSTFLALPFDNHSLMVFEFTLSDNSSCHA